jgi:hypothetical protein
MADPGHGCGLDVWADHPQRKAEHERRKGLAVTHAAFIAAVTGGLPPAVQPAIVKPRGLALREAWRRGEAGIPRASSAPAATSSSAGLDGFPPQRGPWNDADFTKDMNRLLRRANAALREQLDAQQARKVRAVRWEATKAARAAKRAASVENNGLAGGHSPSAAERASEA